MDCGPAPEVPHADIRTNGTGFHDVATYHCIAGYRMTGGDPQLVCQKRGEMGEWEGTRPLCTGKWSSSQNNSL